MADCKRKTANLLDVYAVNKSAEILYAIVNLPNTLPAGEYTLNADVILEEGTTASRFSFRASSGDSVGNMRVEVSDGHGIGTVTTTDEAEKIYIYGAYSSAIYAAVQYSNMMLNTGSTPLPYEPYWQHSLRKLGTSTDTITTLPADLYADGNNATVGLVGNLTQSGTPTPTTPIQPQECGERTGNLFDKNATDTNNGYMNEMYLKSDNSTYSSSSWAVSEYILISENTVYSLYVNTTSTTPSMCFYDSNKTFISGVNYSGNLTNTVTTPQNAVYVRISFRIGDRSNVMLNQGQPRDIEPYGYKISILSGGTTTPVYLGEVQTTRKIKKLVLTGEETDWAKSGSIFYNTSITDYLAARSVICVCSNYAGSSNVDSASLVPDKGVCFNYDTNYKRIYIKDTDYTSLDDFKQYLADQYTAGTPVTVWYVLAEPTTGIVNEPLRKIGDYADTVNSVTIPTIAGADSFDVLTTLKPSEVSLAYTGWHDASVKEWDGSEWQ